ncbi:MAG: ornithine carbamoyltransferase [Armatimonadota bacterium]
MNASSPASPFGAGAALSQPRFLSIADTPREDVVRILDEAMRLREERRNGKRHDRVLAGKTLAMLFEKPSLRTRASFEQAVVELGGHAMVLGQHEVGLGEREPARDVAAVLSGMVDGLAARVFEHDTLRELADHAEVPVINMLSDLAHPCQALADALTIVDAFGRDLSGRMVSFIGDGNNVARSLAMICGRLGMNFTLASPPDYALEQAFADRLMDRALDSLDEVRHGGGHARGAWWAATVNARVAHSLTAVEKPMMRRLFVAANFSSADIITKGVLLRPTPDHMLQARVYNFLPEDVSGRVKATLPVEWGDKRPDGSFSAPAGGVSELFDLEFSVPDQPRPWVQRDLGRFEYHDIKVDAPATAALRQLVHLSGEMSLGPMEPMIYRVFIGAYPSVAEPISDPQMVVTPIEPPRQRESIWALGGG